MAATTQRLASSSNQQAHMRTARTNPWLDTVLATDPTGPSKQKQPSRPKRSSQNVRQFDQIRPDLSISKPKTAKKPAQSSLDEAFQAAIKAIVPERLEATRRAEAQTRLSPGTIKDSPKVTEFTNVTSTNPTIAQKIPKPEEKSLLQTAIEHLTLDRLHTVLYKALEESPKARSVFEREILVLPSPDPGDDEDAVAAKRKMERKRPRFEICKWCKTEFDITDNPSDACKHHTGELKINERVRQHLDGMEDGPFNMDEMREDYPDDPMWNCCQADVDDEGCKTTAHEIDDDHDLKRLKRQCTKG